MKNVDNWYNRNDIITHFCNGIKVDEKLSRSLPFETTPWFNPVEEVEEGELKCKACGETISKDKIILGGEE